MVAVPIAILLVCIGGSLYASLRWLPRLAPGAVGDISFFAVCGLLAAGLAVFGLRLYEIVEELANRDFPAENIFAEGFATLIWETGLLIALALAVYLLAPPREEAEGSLASGADPGAGSP